MNLSEKELQHLRILKRKSEGRVKRGLTPYTKSMKKKIDLYESILDIWFGAGYLHLYGVRSGSTIPLTGNEDSPELGGWRSSDPEE